jgi:putative salt-induced outer membrane protein YdiY
MMFIRTTLAAALAIGAVGAAHAQATVKPDGQWRSALGLGASMSSGNSKSTNLSASGDAVRVTNADKVSLYGNANYAKSGDNTTGEQLRLGGRYDYNIGTDMFAFGGLDFDHNKFANLSLRSQLSAGLGYHVLRSATTAFDVFGGLGYTSDSYINAMVIDGSNRSSYSYLNAILGEESTHKLSDTTSFKQKLVLVPNLKNRGEFLANWDAGLSVAMSKALALNVGFSMQHNSDPGPGRKSTDTLLTTGISVKFD